MTPSVEGAPEIMRREIEARLPPNALGRPLECLVECTSTNDRAKALAEAGAPHGAAVLALAQTRGRGQQGRVWISTPGRGLYLSVILRPRLKTTETVWLSLAAALAVADLLEKAGVAALRVKAPNDVHAMERKISGVLVEPRIARGAVEFAIVGIGLNLTHTEADWRGTPVEGKATSCRMEGVNLPLIEAAAGLLSALTRRASETAGAGRAALRARWLALGGGVAALPAS